MLIEIKTSVSIEINSPSDLPKLRVLMEQNNLKLNKSKLARDLGLDRKTIRKYLTGFEKSARREKGSACDRFHDEICELLNSETQVFHYRCNLYHYLSDNFEDFHISVPTFYYYLRRHPEFDHYFKDGKMSGSESIPVLHFETAPGIQAQLDWKESIPFVLRDTGEEILLNVLVLVMGHSRMRIFMPSLFKTQEVLMHLMTLMFESLGGVPRIVLTDNMKTVMDEPRTLSKPGIVNEKFAEFAKDFGFLVKPCVAATPKTKGKVETQMKFLDEISAYSGKLNLVELFEAIERLNLRCNSSISQGIGKIPIIEFKKEKDSLLPLPNESIRNQYRIKTMNAKVNSAGMISIHSRQYSVPSAYIGKTVAYQIHDLNVYVYFNTKLVAVHRLSNEKLNYNFDHYGVCEGFQGQFKDILFILYPNIKSKEEMIEAIYGTLDYYINHYPQKRFNGKTSGQVRQEAMEALKKDKPVNVYPIKKANRYINFWNEIELKKQKALKQA